MSALWFDFCIDSVNVYSNWTLRIIPYWALCFKCPQVSYLWRVFCLTIALFLATQLLVPLALYLTLVCPIYGLRDQVVDVNIATCLGDVQSYDFVYQRHSQQVRTFQDCEQRQRADNGPNNQNYYAEKLHTEKSQAVVIIAYEAIVVVKDSHSDKSPNTAGCMNLSGLYRIVYAEMIGQFAGECVKDSADDPDEKGRPWLRSIACTSYRDQARQNAVRQGADIVPIGRRVRSHNKWL